jgi:hypothetical protein
MPAGKNPTGARKPFNLLGISGRAHNHDGARPQHCCGYGSGLIIAAFGVYLHQLKGDLEIASTTSDPDVRHAHREPACALSPQTPRRLGKE